MNRHWTEDDCIDRIYGIGRDDAHLDECARCRELWSGFEARRAALRCVHDLAESQVRAPAVDVARPRARRFFPGLAPALAGAGLLAAAVLVVERPTRPLESAAPAPVVSAADAAFFDEVAALEQSPEPRAARTAEVLFEPALDN